MPLCYLSEYRLYNSKSATCWSELRTTIGTKIRSQLRSGTPAILEMYVHTKMQVRSDVELNATVQELLDKEINLSISNHGGKISIVKIQEGKLYITMSGGCQVTLRHRLEVMLKTVAPEIKEIIDSTDHAAGKRPFYSRHGVAT